MKVNFKKTPLAVLVLIVGIAVLVAGILTMALYHDMPWQSYVIIGVIMVCAIWAMLNIPLNVTFSNKEPERKNRREE